jgi:hypothetical protein
MTQAGEPIEDNTIRVQLTSPKRSSRCAFVLIKTERLLSNKGGGLQGTANDWGTALEYGGASSIPPPRCSSKEPVSVDLSSTSDAYFVKEFDRKDAYLEK